MLKMRKLFIYNSRVTCKVICDVTIPVTCFISSDKCDRSRHNLGVGVTIFEAEELENNEIIHVELICVN